MIAEQPAGSGRRLPGLSARPTPRLRASPKVLIVDDDFLIADSLARELSAGGAQVVGFAQSIDRALALATSDQLEFDAAVLELKLNGDTVYPIVDRLRGKNRLVIFATGYPQWVIEPGYEDVPYFAKPSNAAAILATISLGVTAA